MRIDPHARLARLLGAAAGPDAALVGSRTAPWASITFTGTRHHLAFRVAAEAAERLCGLAPEALPIPGHLLVDLSPVIRSVGPEGALVEVDALTLEAG